MNKFLPVAVKMRELFNQKGIIHTLPLLVIVAAVGLISYLLITSAAPFKGGLFGVLNSRPDSHAASSGCQFLFAPGITPVFCETFDNPAPLALRNRSGQLDGTLWGTSRIEGAMVGGSGLFDAASPSTMDNCGQTDTAQPGTTDVIICNGQMRESSYDEHGVSSLAIYPKQPFDFAGRTGTVTFDVSNDSTGSHGTWPEFWITDQPVPAPFTHGGDPSVVGSCDLCSVPRNGIGIDMSGGYAPNQGGNGCQPAPNTRWTVALFKVVRNYVETDVPLFGPPDFHPLGCAVQSSGPNGGLNHVEIRISQNQVDVWSTDAGSSTLNHITSLTNANLSFTRGVIWLEDAHYNAAKAADKVFDPNNTASDLSNHTFAWDNVGFDGPATYRDVSLDVLDALHDTGQATSPDAHLAACPCNMLNLGWGTTPSNPVTLNTVSGFTQANIDYATTANKGALLMFNMGDMGTGAADTINYTVNGHALTFTLPFSLVSTQGPTVATAYHSIAMPVPFSDLVTGPQNIVLSANVPMIVANVNLVLLAAAPVPGATSTAVPTPTSSATGTCSKGLMGDIDCDGNIGIFDFNILVGNFGKTVPVNTQGDIDSDGKVGIFDYNIMLTNFGK